MKDKTFFDLKVSVFYNKKNGQMMVTLPKKKMRRYIARKGVPKFLDLKVKI